MRIWRQVALVSVAAAAVMGAVARYRGAGVKPPNFFLGLEQIAKTPSEKIGPFILKSVEIRGGWSLRLQSSQCDRALYMTALAVNAAPPGDLIKLRYPPAEWHEFYVYGHQRYDTFARVPAHLRLLMRTVVAEVTFSPRDPSDSVYFLFHVPVECDIDRKDAIDASDAVMDLARIRPS